MKQKLFTLVLVVLCHTLPISAASYSGWCGDNLEWSLSTYSGELTITGYGDMYDFTVSWSSCSTPWYSYRESIQSVSLQEGITSIGALAFYDCRSLTSISMASTITSIGHAAFELCTSLASITIPDGVTSIGANAFRCCSLRSIIIPNSVTTMGNGIFESCTSLASASIGNNVTEIGDAAFYECSSLTSIKIPDSVTKISVRTFYHCDALTRVFIGGNVKSIDEEAFWACGALKIISIPNSVTVIGNNAFRGCISLNSIILPNNVTSIGYDAFSNCTSLTSITLPNRITSIESCTFEGCTSLKSVEIPNSVTNIKSWAFANCTSLESLTIPYNVQNIDNYAFGNCTGLTMITCYAETPPTVGGNDVFGDINKDIPVYVLAESIPVYEYAAGWGAFTNILPIGAKIEEVTTITIDSDLTTTTIAWPRTSGAASYDIVIKDTSGKVICMLTFDADGKLTSIAFKAPAHEYAEQQTQTTGFSFVVTGLEGATIYNYTLTAKDIEGDVLKIYKGAFATEGATVPEGINYIKGKATLSIKRFHNGQIFIQEGEKTFTITGQKVK